MSLVPNHLYHLEDSLSHGSPVRACGFLIAQRALFLAERFDEPAGLRRATHTAALIEVVYRGFEGEPNFYGVELKEKLALRLQRMNLRPQEKHFANPQWWAGLDFAAASKELRDNLGRLVKDEVTMCLAIGIEMQVLFDTLMKLRWVEKYRSVITGDDRMHSYWLLHSEQFFGKLLTAVEAA